MGGTGMFVNFVTFERPGEGSPASDGVEMTQGAGESGSLSPGAVESGARGEAS